MGPFPRDEERPEESKPEIAWGDPSRAALPKEEIPPTAQPAQSVAAPPKERAKRRAKS